MNQQHYDKVKRVLAQSEHIMEEVLRSASSTADVTPVAGRCEPLWKTEFPDGWRATPDARLDLSGADLRGGVFAGTYQGFPMHGADLRGAQLDDTRWLFFGMQEADLSGASLRNARAMGLFCGGTTFREADLSGAHLALLSTSAKPIDLSQANLAGAAVYLSGENVQFLLEGAVVDNLRIVVRTGRSPKEQADKQKALEALLAALSETQRAAVSVHSDIAHPGVGRPAAQKKGCFVATACYGSYEAPEVVELRRFRDDVLLRSRLGRSGVVLYYGISPPIARMIGRCRLLQVLVRKTLVGPAVNLARRSAAARAGRRP